MLITSGMQIMSVSNNAIVLVTGATGAVGPRVVQALSAVGYQVRTLSLDQPPKGQWPGNVETRIGDVTDADAVQAAVQGADAVIHMAALLHIVNPLPSLRARYEQINVGGTECVLRESIRAGVRRVVLFSTIAVYGDSRGQILSEDSPANPVSFYARTKRAAEELVLQARGASGQYLGAVLRMGAIYGSKIKGNYRKLLQSLASGWFVPLGDGSNRRTLVYDKDAAQAAVLAMQHEAAAGGLFNVSDGHYWMTNDIMAAMCQALNRRSPRFALPVKPIRQGIGLVEDMAHLVGLRSPVGRATVDKYIEDIAVNSERIRARLGFVPEYNLMAGWRETVQEMRAAGEL